MMNSLVPPARPCMDRPRAYSEGSSRAINTGRAGFFPDKNPSLIRFSESSRPGSRVSDGGHGCGKAAVVYEGYPRSVADADGDGVGDLPGLRSRLGYLADLGVDALLVTPFSPSPLGA